MVSTTFPSGRVVPCVSASEPVHMGGDLDEGIGVMLHSLGGDVMARRVAFLLALGFPRREVRVVLGLRPVELAAVESRLGELLRPAAREGTVSP